MDHPGIPAAAAAAKDTTTHPVEKFQSFVLANFLGIFIVFH